MGLVTFYLNYYFLIFVLFNRLEQTGCYQNIVYT